MMTDLTSVEHRIGGIFERKLNLTVPSSGTDLFESGSLDSLSFVELLLQLELEYDVKIPLQDLDLADFRSIQRIAGFIRQRLAAKNAQQAEPQYPAAKVQNSQPEPEPQYLYIEAKCPA